jgi:hypothetical protein
VFTQFGDLKRDFSCFGIKASFVVLRTGIFPCLSMIALIEPPMIAVMEPFKSAQKVISDGLLKWTFSPPFMFVFSAL